MRLKKLLVLLLVILMFVASGSLILGPSKTVQDEEELGEIEETIDTKDTTAPEIILEGDSEISMYQGTDFEEPGYTATDDIDGDISENVTVTDDIDNQISGIYTITYSVSDSAGNSAEATRTIKIRNSPDAEIDKSGNGLPVLMYHWFYDESIGETGANGNWMEISEFEEQMQYLYENDYYFPTWDEVYDYLGGVITLPEKSVVLTFDDGHESFFRLAVPIIEQYGAHATSFLITIEVNREFVADNTTEYLVFRSHSHDMHRAGSDGNGRFLTMTEEEAVEDLQTSAEILGVAQVFCYPYGHYSDFTKQVLADTGYLMAFTTEYGRIYPNMDYLALPRVRMSAGDGLSSFETKVS